MRILVWNMNNRNVAHDHLARMADFFDIALLQETRNPEIWGPDSWSSVVWRPKVDKSGVDRSWGSAVIGRTVAVEAPRLDEYPWLSGFGGSVAVAASEAEPRWFASVHTSDRPPPQALLDAHPATDVPISTPNQTIWETDLIPFELHRLFGGATFLWGGDLNSAEIMDDSRTFVGGNRKLRKIWGAAGSVDLRRRHFEDEQQTFFARGRRPYQLDHVFADSRTEKRVERWSVDAKVAAQQNLSDHAPIWVELRD